MHKSGLAFTTALLALAPMTPAMATEQVITFTQGNYCNGGELCTNNAPIDMNYGSTEMVTAVLSSTLNSAPNGPLYYYERGFGDLVGVAYSNKGPVSPNALGYIHIVAKSGYELTLKSFNLACFNDIGNCRNAAYYAMPGGGEFLSGTTSTEYPGHTTLSFGSGYGDSLRIWFGVGENVGIDNIRYDVRQIAAAAVPEPATWATMVLGFGLVALARRRRQRIAIVA